LRIVSTQKYMLNINIITEQVMNFSRRNYVTVLVVVVLLLKPCGTMVI
jgi:hypothetical protein